MPTLDGKSVNHINGISNHTAVLMDDGTFLLLGANFYKQCNMPELKGRSVNTISCGSRHTAILFTDGTCEIWGNN